MENSNNTTNVDDTNLQPVNPSNDPATIDGKPKAAQVQKTVS